MEGVGVSARNTSDGCPGRSRSLDDIVSMPEESGSGAFSSVS